MLRWAFVDFTSIKHATATLTNPHNHRLNGRDLVVEYASPDAVRRGGVKDSHRKPKNGPTKVQVQPAQDDVLLPQMPTEPEGSREDSASEKTANTHSTRGSRSTMGNREKTRRQQPAPGAALALAKRESVAIVPSQGTKITFDS